MLYFFDTEIKDDKYIFLSLQKIYGLGKYQSDKICKKLGFNFNYKISEMSTDQILALTEILENTDLILSSELKKQQTLLLQNLVDIKSYKGLRRIKGYPIRGQRTHTNAKNSRLFKKS